VTLTPSHAPAPGAIAQEPGLSGPGGVARTLPGTTPSAVDPPARAPVPVVHLDRVSRTFDGASPVHALRDVSLQVAAGEYLAVVGASGSGKSTLLHIVGLLDRPSAGTYFLDGHDTGALDDRRRAAMRGTRIGFVFQSFHLLAQRTATENVALAELYLGGDRSGRTERARQALCQVGLGDRLDAYPDTLSGGERQRVAVARALVGSPSILLADEPTGNLDTARSAAVMDTFDELHALGITLIVITHDPEVSARARRRVQLTDGMLEQL